MNDLDTRFRSLRDEPIPPPLSPAELHDRARHLSRRRRTRRVGAGLGALLAVAVLTVWSSADAPEDPGHDDDALETIGPPPIGSSDPTPPSTAASPPATNEPSPGVTGAPTSGAVVRVEPAADLHDGEVVRVRAEGLPPGADVAVQQCHRAGPGGGCDVYEIAGLRADDEGRAETDLAVWSTLYDGGDVSDDGEPEVGRIGPGVLDCTVAACEIRIHDLGDGTVAAAAPITFADGVVGRTPELRVDPGGPYRDLQEVTVSGTGFRPGIDVIGDIGQCPVGLDTAKEERCGYSRSAVSGTAQVVVAADGTFSMPFVLHDTLMYTGSCRGVPGCQLGWVLPKGPTAATAPLDFGE